MSFSINQPRGRRSFLRGTSGALMALPLLESFAQDSENENPPTRLVATGVFYGLVPDHFFPKETGPDYEMPLLLRSLEKHRKKITVFSGLDHNLSGGHSATKYFLSGIPARHAKGYAESNISMDQKAAQFVGAATRYPSLALGCETYSENYLSWTRNGAQLASLQSVSRLYELLFRTEGKKELATIREKILERRSILDLVNEQAKQFRKTVSKRDQEKLEQYFTSIRELELRIEQSSEWLDRPKPSTNYEIPTSVDALTLRQRAPFFFDLITLALQTDSTRVVTMSFSDLGKDSGGFDGVSSGYHSLSHHGKEESAIKELTIIESFFTSQFSRFLSQLEAVVEPNGKTLLDNTMALFGSGMSNGNSHSNRDLPVILAGGGLRHGEHRHYAKDGRSSVPLCNLFVTMLQRFGLQQADSFNTSNGSLSELLHV